MKRREGMSKDEDINFCVIHKIIIHNFLISPIYIRAVLCSSDDRFKKFNVELDLRIKSDENRN